MRFTLNSGSWILNLGIWILYPDSKIKTTLAAGRSKPAQRPLFLAHFPFFRFYRSFTAWIFCFFRSIPLLRSPLRPLPDKVFRSGTCSAKAVC